MSMRNFIKLLASFSIIHVVGACSFKKGDEQKEKYQINTLNNGTSKAILCANSTNLFIDDFQTLLSLSTSSNEEDLCTSILNFKRKQAEGTLLPGDTVIFESIVETVTNLVRETDTTNKKHRFQEFTPWATNFARTLKNYKISPLIRLNNLTSNSLLNVDLINPDFAEKKIYIFADSDHLSKYEFSSYFDALTKKLSLATVCSDDAVTLSLRSKRFNSHTMSILERCRLDQSYQQVTINRSYLSAPISNEEIQLFKAAISNNLLSNNSKGITRSSALVTFTSAVKRNDIRLFEMATYAFNDKSLIFYSLALAKDIDYDLEKFIRENSRPLAESLRPHWKSQEIISTLKSRESSSLFNYLSQNDIIPNAQQSEEILKGITAARKEHSATIELSSLESFVLLLKSNTSTKFPDHVRTLNLSDEELLLIVRGSDTSYELAQHFGVSFSPLEKIYLQSAIGGVPEFSKNKKTKLYITGSFLKKTFFPIKGETYGDERALGYFTDETNSYYLKMNDLFEAPIEEISSRILWGPDSLLSPIHEAPSKEAPEEVKSTFLSFAEYARGKHGRSLNTK